MPEIRYCIICEHVRPEVGNKLTILGFYGLTPNVEILVGNLAQPLTVTFLIGVEGIVGSDHHLTAQITKPDGSLLMQSPQMAVPVSTAGRTVLAIGLIAPFPVAGTYQLRASINGIARLQTTFLIRQARPEELPSPSGHA